MCLHRGRRGRLPGCVGIRAERRCPGPAARLGQSCRRAARRRSRLSALRSALPRSRTGPHRGDRLMADAAVLSAEPIEFVDLGAQRRHIGPRMDEAIRRVVEHGRYILGPEVGELERRLGEFCGAKHVLSCANGTDALGLALMTKGVGPGQAVLVPSFTFAATAEVVVWYGATPVFVDVDEATCNIDPASLEAGMTAARRLGVDL